MQLAKCDISVDFPKSSHKHGQWYVGKPKYTASYYIVIVQCTDLAIQCVGITKWVIEIYVLYAD